eukprot:SAG31_NODE_3065_length_4728_cov_2.260531_3_plen_126_part_00
MPEVAQLVIRSVGDRSVFPTRSPSGIGPRGLVQVDFLSGLLRTLEQAARTARRIELHLHSREIFLFDAGLEPARVVPNCKPGTPELLEIILVGESVPQICIVRGIAHRISATRPEALGMACGPSP